MSKISGGIALRVDDFDDLLKVMLDDNLTEFQYMVEEGEWKVVVK